MPNADYSKITQVLNERRIYTPQEEVARKAPAIICAVASRVQRLRFKLANLDQTKRFTLKEIEVLVGECIAPLPFESELLSGNIVQVDQAIQNFPV